MEEQLEPGEVWISGCYSPSLNMRAPHWVINAEFPQGRLTTELRQAWEWAHEDALHFNRPEELNGAEDWQAAVWAGIPPFEFDVELTPIDPGAITQ